MKRIITLVFLAFTFLTTYSQDVIMQNGTVNQCSGTFYDSGGEFGNYANDENLVLTICPENAGQRSQLTFTTFTTQLNADLITIYDGDSTAAPSLGTFSGVTSPDFVEATSTNTSGCLTIEFTSNGSGPGPGWEATISCFTPCQDIEAVLDTTSPAPNGDGEILICVGGDVTFEGSANFSVDGTGATYEWDFGNATTGTGQTVTATYDSPGIYVVDLVVTDTNPLGCTNFNSISQVVRVSPEIDFTGTQAAQDTICFGESTTIEGVASIPQFEDCAPEIFDQTWLEDTPSTGQATSYTSTITVDCYGPGQLLTDVGQITDFCAVMEHSFMGDLTIILQAPNGAQVLFLEYQDGTDPGDDLGIPDQADNGNPGTGFQYCFSPTATQTLDQAANQAGVTDVPAGTYAALPSSSFDNLIGTPLNGNWTFIIIDSWAADDGTLFSWNLNFDPSLVPPSNTIVSEEWDTDATITDITGNTITVQPSAAGEFCYTYRAMDDFGCEYTEEICIEVLPEIITETPDDLVICDTGAPPYMFDLSQNTPVVLASAPNATDLNVTYHETLTDAENDAASIGGLANYSGTDGQVIYIRVEYLTSGCYEILSFTLSVLSQPVINPVGDMEQCDDETNDGIATFDLNSQSAGILGTQSDTDFEVTYHTSFTDADLGQNDLPLDYTTGTNSEQIYVRVESIGASGCYIASALPVFTLTVNPLAIANAVDDMVVCDDASNDGFSSFPIGDQSATILGGQDPGIYNVSYHTSQGDADTNTAPLGLTYTNVVPNLETLYVRVEDPAHPECYSTTSFDLVVNALPTAIIPTPLPECEDDIIDGLTVFTLTDRTLELQAGQANVEVSYHQTQIGADTDTQELFDGYINMTPNVETIYVRLEDTVTGCVNTTTLELQVVANPVAVAPSPLSVCDDDDDGIGNFNLSDRDLEVIGVSVGVSVTYHETEANAINGVGILPTAYTNISADAQQLWVRLTDDTTGCYDVTTLQLIVNPLPVFPTITPYELCDYNNTGDEIEDFDLTVKDTEILNGQVNIVVRYYPTAGDALAGSNEITTPYTNTTNPETIHVALENTLTGCRSTSSFTLMVNPLPDFVVPTPLEVCDDNVVDGITAIDLTLKNQEISGGNTDYAVTYYPTQLDAESETNPLPPIYTNMSNPEVIFVRIEDINTGCYQTTTLTLEVQEAPVAFVPQPLYFCDDDSDGFGEFMLTDVDNEVTGGAGGLSVTYHETFVNADLGVDAIDTSVLYNNIVAWNQTVYVRVESATIATDCETIVELQLIVEPTPQIEDPTPLEECDDISGDGIAQFNLNSKDSEILNGLDATQYTVNYYESEANAINDTNAIGTPLNYTNTTAFNQTLWVRVEDTNTVGGCYKLTTLDLIVNSLPVLVNPTPLALCDVNNSGDEQEAFTLEDANAEILNGQTGISLSYYPTQLDADNQTNEIFSDYTNTSNPQTIYVRAENDVTGCVNTVTLTLRVNPVPSPAPNPTPIEVCDEDNDGFATFNLEDRTVEIINGELDVTITYHETESDADQGINAIVGDYTNIVANNQMIYVRSENTLTGCHSLTLNTLELIVLPSPVVPTTIADYVICDEDDNGIAQFDLTTKDDEILDTQDPTAFILTYHESQGDAETGTDAITNEGNYTNTSNPQTLYVRLESVANGCVSTGSFIIRVELPPTAVQPSPLEACDDLGESPGDELTAFNLRLKDAEITNNNASWSVSYYETDADAQAQSNAITDPTAYTNTSVNGLPANPQTLYVVVTDTDTGCVDYTTLTIRVLPNPTPTASSLLPLLELCDDTNTGDGVEVFDLVGTDNMETLIINGELGVSASYYESEEDALSGTNAIADPTAYENTATPEQVIYVRVSNDVTGCFTLVNFTIRVNPLPEVVAVSDFIACEVNNDGFYDFTLTDKDAEVLNGQDPMAFTVTYHETQADADNLINALVSDYTNMTNPQQIFVAITNNTTGCSISTQSFNLEVQEGAEANSDMEAILYEICDDNMETDGDTSNDSAQFDLTTQNDFILDGQDGANYIVSYYASLEDATLGVNPLPSLYENVVNPQVIYARVDNDTPDGTGADTSICFAVAELTLQVNPLPEFDLEDEYILCVNTNGTEILNVPVLDTGLSTADYSFEWSLNGVVIAGATSPSLTPTEGGAYSVTVTDLVTGCNNSDSTTVTESGPPTVVAEVLTQAFADNHVIEATATGPGDYEYSLDGGPWQDSGVFEGVSAGTHQITARDKIGCGIAVAEVLVIDYPLYFTPNGDGNNDTWNITGIDTQPGAKIYIFDRYGKLLKQLSPTGTGWNGTYNGNMMPTSDYWFTVIYNEPSTGQRKEFNAHFTLKR